MQPDVKVAIPASDIVKKENLHHHEIKHKRVNELSMEITKKADKIMTTSK